jgi:hypothetical protein
MLFHSHRTLLHGEDDAQQARTPPSPAERWSSSDGHIAVEEAKRLLKLVKIEDLKQRLLSTGDETLPYAEVIRLCKDMGFATTDVGADAIARSLDDAGVIFIYRGNVFLRPEKVKKWMCMME